MSNEGHDDLSQFSMFELFQVEVENQASIMITGLLELERNPAATARFEELMRAAHSLKGAARIVHLEGAVSLAHGLEDFFVAAQRGSARLRQREIDLLFEGVDLLRNIARRSEDEIQRWESEQAGVIRSFLNRLGESLADRGAGVAVVQAVEAQPARAVIAREPGQKAAKTATHPRSPEAARVLRLTAEHLNRLLSLAGESLVESRRLHPFANSLVRLKRMQTDVAQSLDALRDSLQTYELSENVEERFQDLSNQLAECGSFLADRSVDFETFDRRSANLSHRLYLQVLQCRMRPFGEGLRHFPRMVRDLSRELGKEVRLEILGEHTQVDRDIAERLDGPLTHLLRNSIDHGCETPEERRRAGKSPECKITIEARHSAGMLVITVSDDGLGLDINALRRTIQERRLVAESVAERLSDLELLNFLLLPGFSLRDKVTEISGRGVGLDVVQNMVRSVRGSIRITTLPGRGMKFQMHLPLTLSVMRALLFEVGGEPYAVPLSQITRAMKLPPGQITSAGGKQFFTLANQQIGLVKAHQVLDQPGSEDGGEQVSVVVIGNDVSRYGLVVGRFLGEREMVVQGLDPRLGKVQDISAGALTEDGLPVLIIDVDDMLRSIEKLVSIGQLDQVQHQIEDMPGVRSKRVLVVEDSLTVRELQRKMLAASGYVVDVAVDGMDGWNAVRAEEYDLVISDVDMPRMDGIELTTLIRKDPRLKSMAVMIVSYKDRDEDRMRGLEAGADYYLTKGSFHDEALLRAVVDLIGTPEE